MKRILLAEDEENIADFVCRGLESFGFEADRASRGDEAWEKLQTKDYDLAVLDIRMPGMTGLDVCRLLRRQQGYALPVIMLTALGTTDDIVLGLQAGADDYMVKPFKFTELVARINALLRRVESYRQTPPLTCGDLSIDAVSHKAKRQDTEVDLSTKEYRLLEYLMRHEGQTLTRRQLLRDVWDKDFDTNTNVVDVYVRYLRQKIDEGFEPKLIHTIVGVGYCFSREDRL
ncbi:response regulator transcription factor [Hallella mizrahii]|uniref:Response regulator transcription factor n=1 Tax=Hallella mizrahii TaxID=2606637 RepID=A0A7K0KDM0_9BACT|nr:response regulator transcription factor [Hallella mizrahii]MST84023.1 response regulator transcription factor [Hallella mizrahii]